jgi:hypothetical protein
MADKGFGVIPIAIHFLEFFRNSSLASQSNNVPSNEHPILSDAQI